MLTADWSAITRRSLAFHEATNFMEQKKDNIHMLSIGTMSGQFTRDTSQSKDIGALGWGGRLFELTISAQEQVADSVASHLLGKKRYCKIDKLPTDEQNKNISLDLADKDAIASR